MTHKFFKLDDLNKKKPKSADRFNIRWEKWADPYGENMNDVEWPGWNDETDIVAVEQPIDCEFGDGDIEYDEDEIEAQINGTFKHQGLIKKPLRIVATPMGIIPMTEYTMPSKIFNFWVGHTNFPVTEGVKNIIEKADGVETLDIFTKYRFKLSIGKMFTSADVKTGIEKKLKTYLVRA